MLRPHALEITLYRGCLTPSHHFLRETCVLGCQFLLVPKREINGFFVCFHTNSVLQKIVLSVIKYANLNKEHGRIMKKRDWGN